MSHKVLIQLVAIWGAMAGVLFYFHHKHSVTKNHFRDSGIPTVATVIKLESSYKSKRRLFFSLSFLRNFDIEVRYFTANQDSKVGGDRKIIGRDEDGVLRMNFGEPPSIGELVITTIRVDREHFRQIDQGDRIEILYLPDDIENAMLKRKVFPEASVPDQSPKHEMRSVAACCGGEDT